ncbi:SpoVG family protein [bacterium]|nr:hypothetical protein [bacterium]MBU3955430.1 SpoVG family protein [bacterium]
MKRFSKLFLALLFVLTSAPKAHAIMGVTEVSINGKEATVVLDGYLKISGIDVLKRADRIKIKLPIYVSKNGKIFPQVNITEAALETRIISAIKMGKPEGGASSRLSYKVSKMSLYEPKGQRSSMKAFSAVTFNNEIEVECKVMTGAKGPWVSWPSTKSGSKWVKQVDIIKPEIKKKIEKSVLEKYEKETSYSAEIVPGGQSLPLTVTEVEVTPVQGAGTTKAVASIVLNNAIKISEIKVKEIAGKTKLDFPAYVNKRGKVYPQIKILDPAFEKDVIDAINKKEPSAKTSSQISYKVSKYSPFTRGGSKLKVFCAMTFNNKIEIECKIMEGKWGGWVSWPARAPAGGGTWINQVEIKDKKLKEVVEQSLTKRYESESGSSTESEDAY